MSSIKIFKAYYEYNDEVDALFIHNKKDYIYDSSIELDQNTILDYDPEGIPVAIELLNTSKIFKVPKNSLKAIDNLHVYVNVTEKSISLEVSFEICLDDKKQKYFFDSLKSNSILLPNIELKIA